MTKKLYVIEGVDKDREFVLPESGTFTIGRAPETQTRLNDTTVSRRHCVVQIDAIAERCLISDMQSASGTLVNGARVTSDYLLQHDDVIQVGETKLQLEDIAMMGTQVGVSRPPLSVPPTLPMSSPLGSVERKPAVSDPTPSPFAEGREARRAQREASIVVECPNTRCGQRLRARPTSVGAAVRCPGCHQVLIVPERTAVAKAAVILPVERKPVVRQRVPAPAPLVWPQALLAPFRALGAWFGR